MKRVSAADTILGLVAAIAVLGCGGSGKANPQGTGGMPPTGGVTSTGGTPGTGGALGTGGTGAATDKGGAAGVAASGGAGGNGGTMATGGGPAAGGSNGSGGMAGTGGVTTSGGAPSAGGRAGAGGVIGAGGATAAGGIAAGGGVGSGGRTGTGGASNNGGATSSGGATGAGGATSTGGHTGGATGAGGATSTGGGSAGALGTGGGSGSCSASPTTYDQAILCDNPVAYLAMNKLSGSEPDLTGNGHNGAYGGGATKAATLPNGEQAADFDGSSQYVTVPSHAVFSIPTTGELTWEAWIRPDILQFPNDSGGYVDWMGKCQDYAPTCEWEARMYNTTNSENRCNRISAYVFNSSAGLGSAADWQPVCGLIQAAAWYHVVGEYTLKSAPSDCANTASYPGSIEIWVNGVKWNHASHGDTGCMSQYNVVPKANNSPVNLGTMAKDAWFQGAIAKVAFYDRLLTQAQVSAHYKLMTGKDPTGSCAATCSF